MISAKGYQTLFSAGIYASLGPLEVQLQPEAVFAANPVFEGNALYGIKTSHSYSKIFPGQSSIRLSAGPVSIGLSSENIWWGPGIRSSLLMSNNAPGFSHVFFQTRKPIRTGIGSFEWQLIGGWLLSDDSLAFENRHLRQAPNLSSKTRYLNGLVISYQPKWVPGLFLGFTRAIQTYDKDPLLPSVKLFERYLPVIALAVQKSDVRNEDSLRRDQLASFFLRWVFPKANMEVYFEYGFNDYGVNFRDYAMSPTHSAAHIEGIRKTISQGKNKWVEFGVELTQMSQSPDWIVRNAGNWYEHSQIWEGYTNQNQILGSGAGFGANVLSLDAKWVNGWKQIGFILERVERDPLNHPVKWIDLGFGVLPQWKHNQFIFSGLFEIIKSNNYIWERGNNPLNIHAKLSIQYNF